MTEERRREIENEALGADHLTLPVADVLDLLAASKPRTDYERRLDVLEAGRDDSLVNKEAA